MKLKAFGKDHIVAAAVVSEMAKYICCYSLDLILSYTEKLLRN